MRKTTPSFIAEFPLIVTIKDERELLIRLDAARNLYNACLGEALRLLELMRQSKGWQQARKSKDKKKRSAAFKAVIEKFGFDSNTLEKFARQCRHNCWIKDHLGSVETQTISNRAFRAVQQYSFGKRGRPRFKSFGRLHSVEAKSNKACITFRDNAIQWMGLTLPIMMDPRDKEEWQAQALSCRTKYCRVIKRTLRGKVAWYCQLVQEGCPPRKTQNIIAEGDVGLDIGPSTIAVVSDVKAKLHTFCPTVQEPWKETRRLQRAMDRSRRATNPDNYTANGKAKPGRHKWNKSSRYKKLRISFADTQRKLAAERKRAHGELCNVILLQGREVKTEKLSYKAFQKCFGKSVKVRAPGMLVSMLKRKAENAGGSVIEITTRTTRLSQFDHTTGEYVKKPLSQRIHFFGDGKTKPVQRDLYSAFLAKHCDANTLNVHQAQKAWSAAEPLLRRATLRWKQSTSRKNTVQPPEATRQSRSSVKEKRSIERPVVNAREIHG